MAIPSEHMDVRVESRRRTSSGDSGTAGVSLGGSRGAWTSMRPLVAPRGEKLGADGAQRQPRDSRRQSKSENETRLRGNDEL